jgi:hypothetical protein
MHCTELRHCGGCHLTASPAWPILGNARERLTISQDIKALLAAHEVIDGLFDSWQIREVDMEKLEFSI